MALAEIVANKQIEVRARKLAVPIGELRAAAQPTERDFFAALGTSSRRQRRPCGPRYILECKRGSPSRGVINAVLDPVALSRVYEPWASAISVLTDARYFAGSFDDLRRVRAATSHPVLCKDFIIDPYQVTEARSHGADAVLLMLSVLDDAGYVACRTEAERLSMGWLTEVHDAHELRRAIDLGAPVIGINNRDLKSLGVDLATTERLAGEVPVDRVLISESGISTRDDIVRLAPHVDGYLIGSAFSGASFAAGTLRAVVFGRTKICGLTRAADAVSAWNAGATHGGVVLGPSRRRVDAARAQWVLDAAPLTRVGVFVNEDVNVVESLARQLHLDVVQLHGDEDADYVARLGAVLDRSTAIWIARRGPPFDARRVRDAFGVPDDRDVRWLFDTAVSSTDRGGTGLVFDRSTIMRRPDLNEIVVAGGICAENAVENARLGAWALDLSSGVEESAGIKSEVRLQALFGELMAMGAARGGR